MLWYWRLGGPCPVRDLSDRAALCFVDCEPNAANACSSNVYTCHFYCRIWYIRAAFNTISDLTLNLYDHHERYQLCEGVKLLSSIILYLKRSRRRGYKSTKWLSRYPITAGELFATLQKMHCSPRARHISNGIAFLYRVFPVLGRACTSVHGWPMIASSAHVPNRLPN